MGDLRFAPAQNVEAVIQASCRLPAMKNVAGLVDMLAPAKTREAVQS